jgi:hypothetical protein
MVTLVEKDSLRSPIPTCSSSPPLLDPNKNAKYKKNRTR